MLELLETLAIARQMNDTVRGKRIVTAAHTPHKFFWKQVGTGDMCMPNSRLSIHNFKLLVFKRYRVSQDST